MFNYEINNKNELVLYINNCVICTVSDSPEAKADRDRLADELLCEAGYIGSTSSYFEN